MPSSAAIVTVTPNPCVDLSFVVAKLAPGEKLRCESPRYDPGGGGINVARVIRRLGGRATAVFPTGGPTGERLCQLLRRERLPFQCVNLPGETREDVSVEVRLTGEQYRFVLPGPRVSPEALRAVFEAAMARKPQVLIASGSLPLGVSSTFYARLACSAKQAGARLALDASGAALKQGLTAGVWLAKPNLVELEGVIGATLRNVEARLDACRSLVRRGAAEWVALTMGAEGAVLVSADEAFFARAPALVPVSTIGAGDSFMAALVLALSRGAAPHLALRSAVAAGAAALLAPGTQLCQSADVRRLAERVCVAAL